jgi:hypothetical protein
VPITQSCCPSYSGDRDQEDHSFKPTPGKIVHRTLSWKYPKQKRTWWDGSNGRSPA